jgi:hypothetical protein
MATATLQQFQRHVWDALPVRKAAVGPEIISDAVMIAVQQWPSEPLSMVDRASPAEADLMHRLGWDIRRMLELLYGYERFVGFWLIGLKTLVPQVIEVIRVWWRARKDNRAKISVWRRKWCNG